MVLLRTVIDLSSCSPSLPGWLAFLPLPRTGKFCMLANDEPEICNSVVKQWSSRGKKTNWMDRMGGIMGAFC